MFIQPSLKTILTPILQKSVKELTIPLGICKCCGYPYGVGIEPSKTQWAFIRLGLWCFDHLTRWYLPCRMYHKCDESVTCEIKSGNTDTEDDSNSIIQMILFLLPSFSVIELQGAYFLRLFNIFTKLKEQKVGSSYIGCENKNPIWRTIRHTILTPIFLLSRHEVALYGMSFRKYRQIQKDGEKLFNIKPE